MAKLLTRDEFRKQVLSRNKGICVIPACPKEAIDAHHILNRRLFHGVDEIGGYFYENGAGLCSDHHYDAELTRISTRELYSYCQIDTPRIPAHFSLEEEYDTWGNIVDNSYQRAPGELFTDEGCQKALNKANVLWMFKKEGKQ